MHVAKLGLESNIPSLFYGDGTYCCTFGGYLSKSCIYSSVDYWTWNSCSFLGHIWYSCPFDLCSCLGEMGSFISDLEHMDFSFYFWFYCCYFLSNSTTCWGSIMSLIVVSFCLLYLFCNVSFSSSSLNLDKNFFSSCANLLLFLLFRRDVCMV